VLYYVLIEPTLPNALVLPDLSRWNPAGEPTARVLVAVGPRRGETPGMPGGGPAQVGPGTTASRPEREASRKTCGSMGSSRPPPAFLSVFEPWVAKSTL